MKTNLRTVRSLPLLLALLLCPALAGATSLDTGTPTSYLVTISDPGKHIFHVAMRINGTEQILQVKMPTWMQASYELQNYFEQVGGFKAHDEAGQPIPVANVDNHTWKLTLPKVEPVIVEYDIDVSDKHKLFGKSYLEKQIGAISGGCFFLYELNQRRKATSVKITLPKGWAAAAAMDSGEAAPDSASFKAKDYDELTDSPIFLGSFKRVDFTVQSIPFSVIVDSRVSHSVNEMAEAARRIATREMEFFGSAPFDRYMFMYILTKDPSGAAERTPLVGVEHLKSTLITVHPDFETIPQATPIIRSASAHELFHAWNVKAIRPTSLNYPDFDTMPVVESLWLLEGFTEYYAQKFMMQIYSGGKYTSFYEQVGQYMLQAQYPLSLRLLSMQAAVEPIDDFVILYSKGTSAGLLLDLKLRQLTKNERGLDDFMRKLWNTYGRKQSPYEENALLPLLNEIAKADVSDYYKKYIEGMDPLPLTEYLVIGGLSIDGPEQKSQYVGWEIEGNGLTISAMDDTGNAAIAGVKLNDKLIALDKGEVNQQNMNKFATKFASGGTVSCTVERNGSKIDIQIKPVVTMRAKITLGEMSHATALQIATRKAVLSATSADKAAGAAGH